jgi:hypothetical protein
MRLGLDYQVLYVCLNCNITSNRQSLNLICNLPRLFFRTIGNNHPGPDFGKTYRQGLADSTGTTSNHNGFVIHIHSVQLSIEFDATD